MNLKEGDTVRYRLSGITGFGELNIDKIVNVVMGEKGKLKFDTDEPYISIDPTAFRVKPTIDIIRRQNEDS